MNIDSRFAAYTFVLGLACACGQSIGVTAGGSGNHAGSRATSDKGGSSGGSSVAGTAGSTPSGGVPFGGMSGEAGAADASGASGMSSGEQAGTSGVGGVDGTAGNAGSTAGNAGSTGGTAGNAGSTGGTAGNAGSAGGTAGGTAGNAGSAGGTAGSGAGGAPPCSCEASKGCIQVTATRAAVPQLLPWERWPSMADGKGTLVASALNGGSLAALKSLNDTDFTTQNPSYAINLCVAPGTGLTVRVHLDEDGETLEYSSSDYPDFCGSGEGSTCPRCMKATVAAGETVKLDYPLSHSCD